MFELVEGFEGVELGAEGAEEEGGAAAELEAEESPLEEAAGFSIDFLESDEESPDFDEESDELESEDESLELELLGA